MSMIQILGADGNAQRLWLFGRISESLAAGAPVVLLVPEQYTLQAERDLLSGMGLPGLLNLDVVSPTRLKALVRDRAGFSGRRALDESGRAMAIHQVLQECGPDLVFYRRLGSLYGAVSRMDSTLSGLREEELTPEVLEDLAASARSGAQRARWLDLSLIWRNYESLLRDRFDDPFTSWQDLCGRLAASGLWRGADLYVYGFDAVRPDLRSLLLAAAEICGSIRVLLTMAPPEAPAGRIFRVQRESADRLSAALEEKGFRCGISYLKSDPSAPKDAASFLRGCLFSETDSVWPEDPSPFLSLYAAPHPTGEALAAVSALCAWHDAGIPWNRMAVALPQAGTDASALLAALTRHGIPCFFSRKEDLSRHGVSRLLAGALACVSQGLSTAPLLEIACSGFSSLSREEGSRLMEYAQAWGIDRGRWRRPFTRGDEAGEMEALRLRLLGPVTHLHDALRGAPGAQEAVEALFRFLQEEDVHARLTARQERLFDAGRYAEAVIDRQVWNLLMNTLDQLYALLENRRASMKEIALLVNGALQRASVSALPEEEDGVLIGRIGHMLPGAVDALIVPGMNDGVLRTENPLLFPEGDLRALKERTGRTVGLDQSRQGMLARSDYLRTFSLPSRHLWVSYCLRDEKGSALLPGEPVTELRRLFPALKEQGGLSAGEVCFAPDSPSLALEGLGPLLRELYDGTRPDLPDAWLSALRALSRDSASATVLGRMLSPFLEEDVSRRISGDTAVRLFRGGRVSISRLECFAGCPFRHFLRYGIRPRLPRSFEFTPADAGDFFHLALRQYIDRGVREPGWPRLSPERIRSVMDDILEQLTLPWEDGPLREDALGLWSGEEYLRRVRHAASVLTEFAANADFRVLGTEMEFGVPGAMPPLILSLPDGERVALQGKIDRLDLYEGPDGKYLRVLDLKSAEKNLDPARMDRGEQLQLMIYLRAALRGIGGTLPAGALYFPIQDKEVNAPTPEAAEARRLKDVQFRGVVLGEEAVLAAMDRDLSPFSLPKALNQDGSISKSAGWALPRETLERLMDAAVSKAAQLCGGIRSGEISASPSVSDSSSPCSFCEFLSVCPVRKADERPLPKGMTFGDVGSGDPK